MKLNPKMNFYPMISDIFNFGVDQYDMDDNERDKRIKVLVNTVYLLISCILRVYTLARCPVSVSL